MSRSKRPPAGHSPTPLPANDLDGDPGIEARRGTTRAGGMTNARGRPQSLRAKTAVEGDVANDAEPDGAANPNRRGRTDK